MSEKTRIAGGRRRFQQSAGAYVSLTRAIVRMAYRGMSAIDFIEEACRLMFTFSRSDAVELQLPIRPGRQIVGRYTAGRFVHHDQAESPAHGDLARGWSGPHDGPTTLGEGAEPLCRNLILGRTPTPGYPFTANGSLWLGRSGNEALTFTVSDPEVGPRELHFVGRYRSLLLAPFLLDRERVGILGLANRQPEFFQVHDVEFFEGLAQTMGLAEVDRQAQWALRERVKELTCLYHIARLFEKPELPLPDMVQGILEAIPPAWQYPESAQAHIVLEGQIYQTPGYTGRGARQSAKIVAEGRVWGMVTVEYSDVQPDLDEGPFLIEERHLIDAIARQLALLVERQKAEDQGRRLERQLRHADRLATIGQLAAGVAHELNEPLGNILGFAQLARKVADLPEQAGRDIDKITAASLHAREIVRKLMLFARQMPPQKSEVDLNMLVEEGLLFLESRCGQSNITVVRRLDPELPPVIADRSQLHQVLVNLVVNAIQAMPQGGTLTLRTQQDDNWLLLQVQDTGVGMPLEIQRQIFLPFFTTKDIHQGTGLGLSVVLGIVTSHGGTIEVESVPGAGSRFDVRFPLHPPMETANG